MANFISKEEAIAQGSNWRQMRSIAAYHEARLREQTVDGVTLSRMSLRKRKELEGVIRVHTQTAVHFHRVADEMKAEI
jgi:hypothetical protein